MRGAFEIHPIILCKAHTSLCVKGESMRYLYRLFFAHAIQRKNSSLPNCALAQQQLVK